MSKKNKIITPILIENRSVKYKLIYFSFTNDGSVYILFPRKNGYKVSKDLNIPKNLRGEFKVSLLKLDEKYNSPYISFHPKSESLHINCCNKVCYKIDSEVLNMSEDKNIVAFPICQIIFPTFNYLDKYKPKKYNSPLVIKTKSISPTKSLSLEVWVHPIGTYVSLEDLPYHKIRQDKMKIVGATIFSNQNLKKYTCSLVICEFLEETKIKKDIIPGIIISIPNKKQQYIFELSPI